ncbi:MAG TPA: biotin transporter BioY [Methanomassiliicoccales archaeon]|jgi:biotin transport system substrate-specific component
MNSAIAYGQFRDHIGGSLYLWRNEATVMEKLGAAFFFAVLTALAAQIRFFLPFTPVPFTGQVLVVLLAAVVIGRYGLISQLMFIGMAGTFGWFTGMVGFAALSGITGGYLFGFLAASFFLGEVVERRNGMSHGQILLSLMVADAIILSLGSLQIGLIMHTDLLTAFALGFLPFVVIDALKVVVASSVASVLIPSKH